MRKYLLAAVAAAAIASPAQAQDAGPYLGLEGGVLVARDTNIDAAVNFVDPLLTDVVYDSLLEIDYNFGYDVDVIGGFDFGAFRLEAELAHKRASLDELEFGEEFIDDYEDATGEDISDADFDLDDRLRVTSVMANALVDFNAGGFRSYAGAGLGAAWVDSLGDSDNSWAWQLIAGFGVPVSANLEAGLKYRFFSTSKLDFEDTFAGTDADVLFSNDSRFTSHSLLASLIFSFGAPAAAPYVAPVVAAPPPPPPPATQTCPDGSIILATDICPAPPPPPPPPPPTPERG